MTLEELEQYDGREGRKAYVAVNGKIYDVTSSGYWPEGDHQGAHQAGRELTEELKSAPHVRSVIDRFPIVGQIQTAPPEQSGGGGKHLWLGAALAIVAVALMIIL